MKDIEWFSKSDPFIRLYRPSDMYITSSISDIPENAWILVHETHHVKDNLNPDFTPFSISGQKLCKNVLKCPLKIEIWDHSKRGMHTFISKSYFNLTSLIQGHINSLDTQDKNGKFAGKILFDNFSQQKIYSMVDLISSGMEFNLYIAMDFTGSNGHPTSPKSLHYMNPSGQYNEYQKGILAVGSILELYDKDKKIPFYGFGAKWPSNGLTSVSHCFPLTGNPGNPYADEISGVFKIYQNVLPLLELYGPTNFSPCIRAATDAVKQSTGKFCYSVLLIITDGMISDATETVDALVEASNYPMSVIIVGVGNEDFTQMEYLDADKGGLRGKYGAAKRDIVQFVEFNRFQGNVNSLGAAVLKELPGQISSYFRVSGIQPPI